MAYRRQGRAGDWLLDTMGRMVRCQSVSALVDLAYDAIRDGLGYDRVGLLLVDPERRTLVEHVGTDASGRKFYPHERVVPLDDDGYYARLLGLPCMQPSGRGYIYLADAVRELPPDVHDRLDGRPDQTLRVALRTGGEAIGLISVDNLTSGRAIRRRDAPPLVAFATALATAVENARLLEQRTRRIATLDASLHQRIAQLAWLQETAARLAALQDFESVLDAVYACLRDGDHVRYDRVGVFLIEADEAGRRISREVRGTDDRGRPTRGLPDVDALDDPDLAVHSPDIHHLLQGHTHYFCPDRWAATPPEHRAGLEGPMGEQMAVALRHDGDLIGYISVDNLLTGRAIGADDAPPLLAFAAQAALAINRARLWAAHEARGVGMARRVRELEWLRDISRRITDARTRAEVLDVVYDGIREGLGYDRVGINLFDHEAGVFEDCIGTDAQGRTTRPMDRTVGLAPDSPIWRFPGIAALLQGNEFYYTTDAYAECPPELRYLFDGAPAHNLMVPLRAGDRATGMISVDNLVSGRPIASRDAGPLLALANQVATAIENARLLERERVERDRLATMATTDALTGLPNRALLYERVQLAIAAAQRERGGLALLLMDLDRFKEVNDTLGHHVGDVLLQQVGARLRETLRAKDTVARLGGDEFAVLLPATDARGATHVARAIHAIVARPFLIEGQTLDVGSSIGIALSPDHGLDTRTLLRKADVAMYVAKRGHGGYALYEAAQDHHTPQRLALVGELRGALAEGQLLLHYQPLVNLADGRLTGAEALARWPHPEQGFIPPDNFIPLAEHTGLIAPLTDWVLQEALRQARAWRQAGLDVGVAMNLSAHTLHDPELPARVAELLGRHAVAPRRLTLEITESALMLDPPRALHVLRRLADLGLRLAIDDFGTGYSSLGYLKGLPVHKVKIDKGFVRGANADVKDGAIVRSVVAMAHALGLEVVAEGVETEAAWRFLAEVGCDTAQGYYVSRPLPAAEFMRWMCTASPGAACRHAS